MGRKAPQQLGAQRWRLSPQAVKGVGAGRIRGEAAQQAAPQGIGLLRTLQLLGGTRIALEHQRSQRVGSPALVTQQLAQQAGVGGRLWTGRQQQARLAAPHRIGGEAPHPLEAAGGGERGEGGPQAQQAPTQQQHPTRAQTGDRQQARQTDQGPALGDGSILGADPPQFLGRPFLRPARRSPHATSCGAARRPPAPQASGGLAGGGPGVPAAPLATVPVAAGLVRGGAAALGDRRADRLAVVAAAFRVA